jgi:hypothetical protein
MGRILGIHKIKRFPSKARRPIFSWAQSSCISFVPGWARIFGQGRDTYHSSLVHGWIDRCIKTIGKWANCGVLGEPRSCRDVVLNRVSLLVKKKEWLASTEYEYTLGGFFFLLNVNLANSHLWVCRIFGESAWYSDKITGSLSLSPWEPEDPFGDSDVLTGLTAREWHAQDFAEDLDLSERVLLWCRFGPNNVSSWIWTSF